MAGDLAPAIGDEAEAFVQRARTRLGIVHQQSDARMAQLPRGIAQAEQVQGKELSYNNINDADAALELVAEFREADPTCVIVKHANPCGVATAATIAEAYDAALKCDDVSAFGGIIAVNRSADLALAGQNWQWSNLTEGVEYLLSNSTLTILTEPLSRQIIRIGVTAAP